MSATRPLPVRGLKSAPRFSIRPGVVGRGDRAVSAAAARRVVVTPAAATDVGDAHDWYETQSNGLGAEFLRAVDAIVATVQRTPAAFPAVHGRVHRALLRRFPYGVFFIESGSDIIVLAVVHSRRHPRVWQSRTEG